jgi:hypothetical protein
MKKSMIIVVLSLMISLINGQTIVRMKLPNNCNASTTGLTVIHKDQKSTLDLYPNPNNGNFTLTSTFNNYIGKATIKAYDMKGKLVYSESIFCDSPKLIKDIKIEQLKQGTYLFEIKNNSEASSSKLIIK